jgi:Rieske Fe-S protein
LSQPRPHPISRRRALSGATTVGIGLPLLAACGDDGGTPTATDSSSSSPAPAATSAPAPTSPESASTSASPEATSSSAPAATGVVSTADVPVGSGVVLADDGVVVTQPAAGDIHVFDVVCTHQGCPVGQVTDVIVCPCHGSEFDLTSGEPLSGPATAPLSAVGFSVEGDQVVLS